ncbi:MAG: succinylglutamate desuccinylase/aspartoacylase family protein [Acidobacteria bacterium]|nr:succinylglutamate desuccinylase/aspartoacylase family protein [Acidobacteriota bacterium]
MIDTRPALGELMAAFDALAGGGWQVRTIASQVAPDGGLLPIRAYFNADEVNLVLVAGIHGREPAGPVALARLVPSLIANGLNRRLLVMPLLNPWGYVQCERYGPSGKSVSDSDHLLGRAAAPACPEAAGITGFVMNGIRIPPGAAVLDLHEDPVYEAPDYHYEGFGSYLYFIGDGAPSRASSRRVVECLRGSSLPLVRDGLTRFGEAVVDGAIVDSEDGSIDELFARRLGCTPVITVENLLHGPESPPLAQRVEVYVRVVEAFLNEP